MGIFTSFAAKVIFRSILAVIIGVLIGNERARHGRAAGMRTHVLVCLGATLTSMTGIYISENLGYGGDVFRISAQVVSGVGFLGAGMIILKDNNVITGLTTAAGVWTTIVIGIALGYGFYVGAIVVTALFSVSITLFARFERRRKSTQVIYVEIDDMYRANEMLNKLEEQLDTPLTHQMVAPKSACQGHLGLVLVLEKRRSLDIDAMCAMEHVVFVEES